MRKRIVAVVVIACLMAVSLSTLAWSNIKTIESTGSIREKGPSGADTGLTSGVNVPANGDKADGSSTTQSKQTLNRNEDVVSTDEVDQNQVSNLPAPLPDGRIFLQPGAGTEDPIAYIPTQNPKTGNSVPIEPPELGS